MGVGIRKQAYASGTRSSGRAKYDRSLCEVGGARKSHGSHSKASQLLAEIEYDKTVNWFRDGTVKSN